MKSLFVSLALTCLCSAILAQDVELITQNADFHFTAKATEFYYISKELDSSRGIKVADVKLTATRQGNKDSLVPMFYRLRKKAMDLGANAYFIAEMSYYGEEQQFEMYIELWSLNEVELDENYDLLPKNLIVVIGNMDTKNEEKGKGFKMNKQKMTLMPYSYIVHENKPGEKCSLSIGGFMGASMSIIGEEGKPSVFASLGGVAVAPMMPFYPNQGVGISISTGQIYPVEMELGFFLKDVIDMLDTQEDEKEDQTNTPE